MKNELIDAHSRQLVPPVTGTFRFAFNKRTPAGGIGSDKAIFLVRNGTSAILRITHIDLSIMSPDGGSNSHFSLALKRFTSDAITGDAVDMPINQHNFSEYASSVSSAKIFEDQDFPEATNISENGTFFDVRYSPVFLEKKLIYWKARPLCPTDALIINASEGFGLFTDSDGVQEGHQLFGSIQWDEVAISA